MPPFLRHAYIAILALWLVMPLLLAGRVAQDAIPYVAAGNLAHDRPSEVYAARHGDLFDLRPGFRAEWCRVAPADTDCDDLAVAFVASPPVVPLTVALSTFGDRTAMLLMQFLAAGMLATGMWLLWLRLAHRTRNAPRMLIASALLLTPMAMVPIGLGQTSPVMFLSVALGLGPVVATHRDGARRGRDALTAVVWAAASALKVFPSALIVILVWRRRWSTIVLAISVIAVLSLATVAIVPISTWGDFIRTTLELNGHTTTNPYNGAVGAFVIRLFGLSDSSTIAVFARLIAIGAAGLVCWFGMRRTSDDTRWAAGWLALLLVTPVVWWHYVWVVIGAIGIVIAAQRRLDDRTMAIFPIAALVSIAPSIPNANGHSWPIAQGVLLLAGAATFCVLARRQATHPQAEISSSGV